MTRAAIRASSVGLAVTCALMLVPTAVAQYAIRRYTLDGGGGRAVSSAGTYSLGATIGQPDAGPASGPMIGGSYSLAGGFWMARAAVPQSRFYVNASASPGGNGGSWATAYQHVQTALANAASGAEIWVARGTYMPDGARRTAAGAYYSGSGNNQATFELINGVALYGGFAGTESALSQRNILQNVTTLSGDIYGNDTAPFDGYSDNSATVVTARGGQDASAVLDGFRVTGATSTLSGGGNGGVMCVGSSPTLSRCILSGNLAWFGGGIFCDQAASPTLFNCVVAGNTATYGGGVACRDLSNPTLINCTVYQNSADFTVGGGVWSDSSSPALANCIVSGNYPNQIRGSVSITNCDVEGEVWPGTGNLSLPPQLTPDGHLTSASPCINAGSNSAVPPAVTIDLDDDPRVFPAGGVVDIGADEFKDSDGDGLPDWWEAKYPAAGVPNADSDGDCITNLQEYEEYGSDPTRPPLLVPSVSYPTIQAALDAAGNGDTVNVASGVYLGSGNTNLDFKNHAVVLRGPCSPPAPPIAVTIDCQNQPDTRLAIPTSIPTRATEPGNVVIEGIIVTGGAVDFGAGINTGSARLLLRNCILQNNAATFGAGGLYSDRSLPLKLDGLTIGSNNAPFAAAGVLRSGTVQLLGALNITSGTLQTLSTRFPNDSGSIQLTAPGNIQVSGTTWGANPTFVRTNVSGTGNILIDPGQTLSIENGAIVDLSGQDIITQLCEDPCPTSDPSTWGTITVNGTLLVTDATIQNTKVHVKLARLEGETEIVNNDIRLLQSSAGFGGEFFVQGGTIQCNKILSEGDRYLDMDPDPNATPRPTVCNNSIEVLIKQGVSLEQGELLELRSEDFDTGGTYNPTGQSGAWPVPVGSAGFVANPLENNNWSLEKLEVLAGAKVNLTDRQGFEFHGVGVQESLYVKDLILHPNAVLNTALRTLYYNHLYWADGAGTLTAIDGGPPYVDPLPNGARVLDYPLLGFSLKVIAMENETEFDVRVRRRLRDSADDDDQPPAPPFMEGSIARVSAPVTGDPQNDAMEMRTQAAGSLSATSVAAHGAFARAGEDQILVIFKYLFCGQSTDKLNVYLSDSPEVSTNLSVPIAVITPPTSGPGSVGSGQFAEFSGHFPKYTLNFLRGTYVELELVGQDACVLIDDWDPVVCLWCQCGDMSGEGDCGVTEVDYLYLLSEYGHAVNDSNNCADQMGSDNYVDLTDLNAWSSQFHNPAVLNLCDGEGGSPGGTTAPVSALPPSGAVIAGKPGTTTLRGTVLQNDKVYAVDDQTQTVLGSDDAPAQNNGVRSGHGRLITDPSGELYQVHGAVGLIRLSDGQVVLPPRALSDCPSTGYVTRIGVTGSGGYPIADVAFDPLDPNFIYVAPVQVDPPGPTGSNCPYRAVARVKLGGTTCATAMATVFGGNPALTSSVTIPSNAECWDIVYNPDRSRIREIEVDSFGNLFVATAQEVMDNDYVLIYPVGGGAEIPVPISGDVEGPTALCVDGDKLYVTTSLDGPDTTNTVINRYSIMRSGNTATGLIHDQAINLPGMRFLTTTAVDPANGKLWALGFSADTCSAADCALNPNCTAGCTYGSADSIFTTPMLAIVANPGTAPVVEQVLAMTGSDLALPLGLAFPSAVPQCGTGDYDGGGTGYSDVALFVAALLNPTPETICPGDTNADGDLNGADIQGFLAELIGF